MEAEQAETAEFDVAFEALAVTPAGVARAMGYPDGAAPGAVAAVLHDVWGRAPGHAEVRAGFHLLPGGALTVGRADFRLGEVSFASAGLIAGQLRGAVSAAVFVATAGRAFDAWRRALFDGDDPVIGFVVDALGSAIAEAAADWIEARIAAAAAARAWGATNRFSPGYCGWPVADQHGLFSLVPPAFCGVSLTGSALMVPMKSVSGVIGVGPGVRRRDYPCRVCDEEDCYRRRAGLAG